MNRLFTTVDEITKYVRLDPNIEFTRLTPFIEDAQISFMKPLLGALYDQLVTDYTTHSGNTANMNSDLATLLPYVQRPLSHHMMFLGVTQLAVSVGNMGVMQERSQDHDPAPKWRNDQLKIDYLKKGDVQAETLLGFLEQEASTTKYNTWYTDDSANTIGEGLICRTASVALKHVDIEAALRRIFIKMKKRIRRVESEYIQMLICSEQYEELTTQIKTDSVTSQNQVLIEKLEPIIAKMSLHQTIPMMQMHLSENGLTIYSSDDDTIMKNAATDKQVDRYLKELQYGKHFGYEKDIDVLKQFIEDNIDTYPLIKNSSCYTSKPEEPNNVHRITNTRESKFFAT